MHLFSVGADSKAHGCVASGSPGDKATWRLATRSDLDGKLAHQDERSAEQQ